MQVAILTAFPDMFTGPFAEGMIRIARESGQLVVHTFDYRAFTDDRHRTIDDAPFGGGAGMILKPEPVVAAIEAAERTLGGRARRVLLSPQGERFDQRLARELAAEERITLVTGRYKEVDERVRRELDDEISVGDYILSGGEVPAMIVVDAVARLLPGVVGDRESVESDSFESPRLDAPYYTRPATFRGREVPEVLRSGHHGWVDEWRAKERLRRSLLWRPDLLEAEGLEEDDRRRLAEIRDELNALIDRLIDRGDDE